jgi:hypothetical protein
MFCYLLQYRPEHAKVVIFSQSEAFALPLKAYKIALPTKTHQKRNLHTMNKLIAIVTLAAVWPSVSANAASSNSRSVAGSLILPGKTTRIPLVYSKQYLVMFYKDDHI